MDDFDLTMLAGVNDRVALGAAWLDLTCPGWEVSLTSRLEIGAWDACVLGQLSEAYGAASEPTESAPEWLGDHGFLLGTEVLLSYDDLSAAWEALIYARGARNFFQGSRDEGFSLAA